MLPLTYMQIDVGWAYNRKVRRLQRLYPEQWPAYWAAYMALLGEVWQRGRAGRKLTVLDAWCPALRVDPAEALAALVAAGVTDKAGRIPAASWKQWVEPVMAVLDAKRAGGLKGAAIKRANGTPSGSPSRSPSRSPNAEKREKSREKTSRPLAPEGAGAREGQPKRLADTLRDMGIDPTKWGQPQQEPT